MTYDEQSHITTKEDVKTFVCHIINDLGTMFHIGHGFSNYAIVKTGVPYSTKEDASNCNRLMDGSFNVYVEEDEINDITFTILQKAIKKGFEPKCGISDKVEIEYE